MDWSVVNTWLSLGANLGVLAGLFLVAAQIRQNTEITKAQVANEWFVADMQLELAMMGENPAPSWIKAIYRPGDLDEADAAVLDRYFNYGLVQIQRLERMHQLGLADDQWRDRIGYLGWHLGNDVGRRWWSHFKQGFSPEFSAMVDEILETGDADRNRQALDALRGSSDAG